MKPADKRLENIKFLKKALEGKLKPQDVINAKPGWRIWLNLTGVSREQYIQDCIDKGIPPPPEKPQFKITLNLNA